MATSSAKPHLLILLLVAVAQILAAPSSAARCRLVHLHLYMHDIIGGPGQTAVRVVKGQGPPHPSMPGSYFGDTAVIDDLLTEGPSLTSKAVGRAQGTYVLAAMDVPVLAVSVTVVITEGPYNGSTLVIAGRDDISQEVRELAVVGGTGQLRRATGHVLWRTAEDVSAAYMVLELDVHATVPNGAAPAPGRRHGWGWPPAAEASRNMSVGLSADS